MWPIHLAFLLLIIRRIFLFSWPSSLFPRSVQFPSFSSTKLQGVSDLFPRSVQTSATNKAIRKCSILLVYSVNIIQLCCKKIFLLAEWSFFRGRPRFYFTCISCITRYLVTQIVNVFRNTQFFLV